jgi:hypothetical protein
MKRVLCIEITFEDRRKQGERAGREASEAESAAKAAAKGAASAVLVSAGFKVTSTSSSSTYDERQ